MNILFATSEVTPFARTGGLADVCASLPLALEEIGQKVTVVMPAYKAVFNGDYQLRDTGLRFPVRVGDDTPVAKIWKSKLQNSESQIYFVQHDPYFSREQLYTEDGCDYSDNCERFVFFCRAVLELISLMKIDTDILHTNDWQTGMIPAMLKLLYQSEGKKAKGGDKNKGRTPPAEPNIFDRIATIHTIHNLAYQGIFKSGDLLLTGIGWEHFTFDELEFYGKLNLMKAGVVFADGVTTVSPRYALEIQSPTFGCGMESVLQYRSPMLRGILNGVCPNRWNPATDPYIAIPYDSESVFEKKPVCKHDLQTSLGLAAKPDVPLCGVVSRFAYQKGIDLVADVMPLWIEKHGVQFVLLGTGNRDLEIRLAEMAAKYPDNLAVRFEFSDGLSHKIEAGSDMFLMPSRYEPCGLNQMYSQLYGTVPVVHDTGGLADTVVDANDETIANSTATGFSFFADRVDDLNMAMWRALNVYWNNKEAWHQIVRNCMRQNWSWTKSAMQYVRFYEKVVKK